MDEPTVSAGLLMEAAQNHQRLAEAAVERLNACTRGLEGAMREELRGCFMQEFQELGEAARHATEALQRVRRIASVRLALWSITVCASCTLVPLAVSRLLLPSPAELARLQAQRDALNAALQSLQRQGARLDLRRCGESGRLCVRIERSAPPYGRDADYRIVKGD